MFTDAELNELLGFISGKIRIGSFGNGIHAYPSGDENHKKIFAGCVELEKRGLVYRFIDEPDHVCFVAKESIEP